MRSGWLVVVVLVSFVAGAIWTLCEVHDQVRSGLVTFAGEAWHTDPVLTPPSHDNLKGTN